MDTDVLRWFKQVAEGATVTEVSDLEAVTQSGISRALARLEGQVGTPLLRRVGRRLRLTRAGEVFKPYVDALLHQLEDGMAAVSQFIAPDTGVVRLAFQQSLGTWLIPDLVRSFRASHPAVGFHLSLVSDELHSGPLDSGEADLEIGTRLFTVRQGDFAVRTLQIAVDPLRLAVPRDHRLAGQREVRLTDVASERFIGLRRTSALRRLTDELCRQAGFRPEVVFEGDDLSYIWGFVAAGLGVAIIPAPMPGPPEAIFGLVQFLAIGDRGAERAIYLTWPAGRPLLPAAELFREHVVSRVSLGEVPAPFIGHLSWVSSRYRRGATWSGPSALRPGLSRPRRARRRLDRNG